MTKLLLGLITCKNKTEAKKIAKTLIKSRLCACCNILPGIQSIYWWKNKIEQTKEVLLMCKTLKGNETDIINAIKLLHSYELPAIEFLPLSSSKEYKQWIQREIR